MWAGIRNGQERSYCGGIYGHGSFVTVSYPQSEQKKKEEFGSGIFCDSSKSEFLITGDKTFAKLELEDVEGGELYLVRYERSERSNFCGRLIEVERRLLCNISKIREITLKTASGRRCKFYRKGKWICNYSPDDESTKTINDLKELKEILKS